MIYISGKITGTNDYLKRFSNAEKHLQSLGYTKVINPAKVNNELPEMTHEQYMIMSITMLQFCNTIYLLNGYESSKGALHELSYAIKHHYKIIREGDL